MTCLHHRLLTEILTGGVKMTYNPLLCYVETIQWWDILDRTSNPIMLFKIENFTHNCMTTFTREVQFVFCRV